MKRLILAMTLMALTLSGAQAQSGLISAKKIYTKKADMSAYAAKGAVPEVNGKIVFTRQIEAPGKSKDFLYKVLSSFAALRFEANATRGEWKEPNFFKNIEYAQVTQADSTNRKIVAQGAEEMIFSNKALAKDYTHVYYRFTAVAQNGKVDLTVDNIAYIYVGSQDTERIPAEDWITDAEALNKKGQLRRISGKFRVKTIDLANELADEIEQIIKTMPSDQSDSYKDL